MKLIIANWKLNPMTVKEAVRLACAEDYRNAVIAPPFPFLKETGAVLKRAKLGAQNISEEEKGAFTGEVSAFMLRSVGVRYAIIGHSERRARGETDDLISEKVKAALAARLTPVLCVGEPRSVRKRGLPAAKRYVARQLRAALVGVSQSSLINNQFLIAYEPLWAIGTGKPDDPAEVAGMAKFIKEFLKAKSYKLKTRVLYGGSVTPRNAGAFLCAPHIDGALVGGASLSPKQFVKILASASSS